MQKLTYQIDSLYFIKMFNILMNEKICQVSAKFIGSRKMIAHVNKRLVYMIFELLMNITRDSKERCAEATQGDPHIPWSINIYLP